MRVVLRVAMAVCGLIAPSVLGQGSDWVLGEGYRFLPLRMVQQAGQSRDVGFTSMPASRTGIQFTNVLEFRHSLTNHIYMNGSGVALGDIDGDGYPDIYFCRLNGANVLYRNQGDWKFEDITGSAGVACEGQYSTGAAFADVNGNGHLDLLVAGVGVGVRLFVNDGTGRFEEQTDQAGLRSVDGSMTMAFADIQGNGALDLYVVNYRTWTMRDSFNLPIRVRMENGRPQVTHVFGRPVTDPDLTGRFTVDEAGGLMEHGELDALYLNDGHGRFRRVSFGDGLFLDEAGRPLGELPFDWGLSAMFRDITGNGYPDLYVCNDLHSKDRIWLNRGDGSFQEMNSLAIRKGSWFSMGVDFGDLDRDGLDDFFVVDMLSRDHRQRHVQVGGHMRQTLPLGAMMNRPRYSRNSLYWNLGDGAFLEAAFHGNVHASEWSWSPVFVDVDLDGYEDILITTGFERDVQDADIAEEIEAIRSRDRLSDAAALRLRERFPRLADPNIAFRNLGNRKFQEVGREWGFDFAGVSQGMALADLDGDGDLDVVINNMNEPPLLLRNESSAPRIAVRLKGRKPNTYAVGSKIRVLGGPVRQSQEMLAGGRYLSSDAPIRTFAAGSHDARLTVEVVWSDGQRSVINNVRPNYLYEINQGEADSVSDSVSPWVSDLEKDGLLRRWGQPHFEDRSRLLGHRHGEDDHDDYSQQPLLPRRMSRLGPGVAWVDLDGDGFDDLVVGSGVGGQMGVFLNRGGVGLTPATQPLWQQTVGNDQTGLAAWADGAGDARILVGTGKQVSGNTQDEAVQSFHVRAEEKSVVSEFATASTGPLALTSWGNANELVLFVGGRFSPGRYPEGADSQIYRLQEGKWAFDSILSEPLRRIGMVSGAVWSDLNGDGYSDLVVACEWGGIQIFQYEQGHLVDRSEAWGLNGLNGWWNGVASGDFNGDGFMDVVVGNWGNNIQYTPHLTSPVRLYYGDFQDQGILDLVESYFEPGLGWVPRHVRSVLGASLSFLQTRFESHRALGNARVEDVLKGFEIRVQMVEASMSEHLLLRNVKGKKFTPVPLHQEAQWAPVLAVCVGDLDGSGNEDLFLGQNFFAVDPLSERYDAGRSVWLRGNGDGTFDPVHSAESGLYVFGDQRGAALGDFDRDGRTDIVVAQNAGPTRLFRNRGAKAGLRVRLVGRGVNGLGLGASIRLEYAQQRLGPAREIQSGSGYWSVNSAVQVLGMAEEPLAVRVRWPGGETERYVLQPGGREVRLVQGNGGRIRP